MACYNNTPAEIKLMILESCPDVSTLHSLVQASPAVNGELYAKHAHSILPSNVAGDDVLMSSMKSATFAAVCSNGSMEYTAATLSYDGSTTLTAAAWSLPSASDIWKSEPHFRANPPQQLLSSFAAIEQEIEQLTAWCTAVQAHARIGWLTEGKRRVLHKDEIRRTLWGLRLYIARAMNISTASVYTTSESSAESMRQVKWDWIASHTPERLVRVYVVLFALRMGAKLLGSNAREGGMLQVLFATPSQRIRIGGWRARSSAAQDWQQQREYNYTVMMLDTVFGKVATQSSVSIEALDWFKCSAGLVDITAPVALLDGL